MRTFSFSACIALLAILLTTACNDPTTIGADLLDDDRINTTQTDTITINASSIFGERTQIYDDSLRLQTNFLLGNYNDPLFGKVTSNLLFQLAPPDGFRPSYLDIESDETLEVDSMVMVLPYNIESFYGATEEIELEVYTLANALDPDVEYYSDDAFDIAMDPIATYTFTPMPMDSFIYFRDIVLEGQAFDGSDSIVTRRFAQIPQMRLKLPTNFTDELINQDEGIWDSAADFLEAYPGFYFKVINDNGGMMSIDFNSAFVGLEINTKAITPSLDTTDLETFINVGVAAVKTTEFRHDFTGSIVESIVNSDQDTLLAVQGMEGVVSIIELPYIDSFKDLIINKAELTVDVLNLDGNDIYDEIDQIIISSVNSDGTYTTIQDFFFPLEAFGGVPITDVNGNTSYTFNITAAIQRMRDGGYDTNKLALTTFGRGRIASRVMLAGPKHSSNPMKMRIIYTEL